MPSLFSPKNQTTSYILKGKCPSVIPSFQKDSDVRAPSTYRHLRTWALRRVLAFGFVRTVHAPRAPPSVLLSC
eukprot:scaffold13089_cov93-Skeletonema_dohrnii-CCMP3373.AAC.1